MKFGTALVFSLIPVLCPALQFLAHFLTDSLEAKLLKTIDTTLSNTRCGSDLKKFITDLRNSKMWALQMFDANSKLIPGLLSGNIHPTGNYDECLAISEEATGHVISGQYCNMFLVPNNRSSSLKTSFKKIFDAFAERNLMDMTPFAKIVKDVAGMVDICIPKSCSTVDFERVWDHAEESFNIPLGAKIDERFCQYKNKPVFPYQIDSLVFWFFGVTLAIVFAGTAYDVYLQRINGKESSGNVLVVFSLYTNCKKLLSTHCENDSLTCLYGIRVLTMLWIMLAHFGLVKIVSLSTNWINVATEHSQRWRNSILLAGTMGVETFFCISGLLVTYVQLKYSEMRKINALHLYAHRILRLVPVLLAVVLVHVSLVKQVADGPFSRLMVDRVGDTCRQNWLPTMLFFSNFLGSTTQCIQPSWYLSVDTQLYLVSPLILFYIRKERLKVLLGMVVTVVICIVYCFIVTYTKQLGSVMPSQCDEAYMHHIYRSPMSHIPCWLLGVALGDLLYSQKITLSRKTNLVLWTLSLATMLILVMSPVYILRNPYNVYRAAFYNALSKPLWSLAVCFIIFSCSTGHAGFINKFLSHPVFIVLGKLTYAIFLTHALVMGVYLGNQHHHEYYSNLRMVYDFCGVLVTTLACSAAVCLIFETPVVLLMKILGQRRTSKRHTS